VELADVSRPLVIAYWLIPSEPGYSFFRGVIKNLARRYDAPVFEPHVTVHVGANGLDAAERALSKASRDCKQVALAPRAIDHSNEFIKTLFVQFDLNAKLRQVNQIIRTTTQDSTDYELNPHLSLLYKRTSTRDRRLLADSIEVPFHEVTFDSLKAVQCISPTQTRADVEAWRVVAEKYFIA
jgi:Cyclic phosphodiesterase-like protein